ncbi:MAG TPA: DUF2069 domain-containing protein [Solimonas sp.]|nr:DUF2069 domain-containing protein [Solimonas sp.]
MKPLSRWPHAIAVAAHLTLIAGLLWSSRSTLGMMLALLLFLPLPGLLRGNARTHAWVSMLIAFYCAGLLSNAYSSAAGRGLSFGLAAVAAIEFCAVMMYVRFDARERRAAAG